MPDAKKNSGQGTDFCLRGGKHNIHRYIWRTTKKVPEDVTDSDVLRDWASSCLLSFSTVHGRNKACCKRRSFISLEKMRGLSPKRLFSAIQTKNARWCSQKSLNRLFLCIITALRNSTHEKFHDTWKMNYPGTDVNVNRMWTCFFAWDFANECLLTRAFNACTATIH